MQGDNKEAVKWFRLAAEQGDAEAQINLGVMYETGRGVPKDDKEAVKWYRLAAEQGDADAQFNVGVMHHNGTGVPQDFVMAYAVTKGDEIVINNSDSLYPEMTISTDPTQPFH